MNTDLAIIGNGCAAVQAVESIRRFDQTCRITIFSDSMAMPYNPMLLTYLLSGKVSPKQFYLVQEEFYQKHRVELVRGKAVKRLEAREKRLMLEDGSSWQFRQALIASGSSPFVPPVPGSKAGCVFTLRTLEGAQGLMDYMAGHSVKKALVIGASMIGIKAVEYFHQVGVECCLVNRSSQIFSHQAMPKCAAMMQNELEKKGISLRFSASLESIEENGDGSVKVHFKDGKPPEEADVVVLCIGVRANLNFVDKEEIACRQGILVDQRMQTSVPGIYAAGDCAQGDDLTSGEQRVIGLLANGRFQAQTAGWNMAGHDSVYGGTVPHNITRFMGMIFTGIGDPGAQGDAFEIVKEETCQYVRVVRQDGKIVSVNLLNVPELSGILKSGLSRECASAHGSSGELAGFEGYAESIFHKVLHV